MSTPVEQAKSELRRCNARLKTLLETTPDDKLNWRPSSSSRTPIEIVGHTASSIEGIQKMLMGNPFPFASTAELDAFCLEQEKTFTSREQVLELLDAKTAVFIEWLDSLTPEQLATKVRSPFGEQEVAAAAIFPAMHALGHCSQLEYIQTIYGDRDWHYV